MLIMNRCVTIISSIDLAAQLRNLAYQVSPWLRRLVYLRMNAISFLSL